MSHRRESDVGVSYVRVEDKVLEYPIIQDKNNLNAKPSYFELIL
jgi:hypothetical protein